MSDFPTFVFPSAVLDFVNAQVAANKIVAPKQQWQPQLYQALDVAVPGTIILGALSLVTRDQYQVQIEVGRVEPLNLSTVVAWADSKQLTPFFEDGVAPIRTVKRLSTFASLPGKLTASIPPAIQFGAWNEIRALESIDGLLSAFNSGGPADTVGPVPMADSTAAAYFDLVRSLGLIPVPAPPTPKTTIPFSGGALSAFQSFEDGIEANLHKEPFGLLGWLGDYPAKVARLAGLLHIAAGEVGDISSATVGSAIALGQYYEDQVRQIKR